MCVLNAGSVGMPFADQLGAYWLLHSPSGYEFRHTLYDKEIAANEVLASSDPQAQEFTETYILDTLSKGIEIIEKIAKNRDS